MSTRALCRLCLAMDVPMHDIADSPLQSVYKKLTNISLPAAPRPVAACYLCYCQLRKSHDLMVRCLKAHEVFTQLLRSGEGVNVDLITVKNHEIQELSQLVFTPVELIVIGGPGHSPMNTTIKEEPLSPLCKEEIDTDGQECIDNVIFEESVKEKDFGNEIRRDLESTENDDWMDREQINKQLEDAVDIESDVFPNVDIKQEKSEEIQSYATKCIGYLRFEGEDDNNRNELTGEGGTKQEQPLSSQRQELMETDRRRCIDYLKFEDSEHEEDIERVSLTDIINIKNEEFIDEKEMEDEELEEAVVAESMEDAGAARAEKCKETRAGTRQDGGTLTPGGENVLEEQRTRSTEEEKMSRNIGRYQLRSTTTTKSTDCTSTKHSRRTFVCDDCGDVFGDKCLLIEHIEQHVTDNKTSRESSQHRTRLLNQKLSRTGAGNKHIEACSRRFTCEICQVRFIRKGHLKAHLHRHTGEKPYQCAICKASFRQKSYLKRHIRIHTGEKPYECEICKVRFRYQSNLKTHLTIHTGEKPYECEICKVRFSKKSYLKRHIRIHTSEKPYECEICKVGFSEKCSLKKHLRIHTGEKPYECEICKVRFNQTDSLKRHLRIHTGEKPYECEICKVRFSLKGSLKTHLRIHTGEKPYECKICKVRFRHKISLKIHLRIHTGEKLYECEICKARYTRKHNLYKHCLVYSAPSSGERVKQP